MFLYSFHRAIKQIFKLKNQLLLSEYFLFVNIPSFAGRKYLNLKKSPNFENIVDAKTFQNLLKV
jgi:hypothetical protein